MALLPHIPSRYRILLLACIQQFATSGIIFGWPAFQRIVGVIPDLDDDFFMSQVFVIASTLNMLSPLLLSGPLLDRCGPRTCSSLSLVLVFAGFFTFGINQSRTALTVSISLIAVGGPGCQSSLFHISNLFPEYKNTSITCIAAFFSLSYTVFLILASIQTALALSISALFLGYSFLIAILFCLSVVCYPDMPYSADQPVLPAEPTQPPSEKSSAGTLLLPLIDKGLSPPTPPLAVKKPPLADQKPVAEQPPVAAAIPPDVAGYFDLPLYEQLRTKQFAQILIFFVIGSFWFNFTVGSFHLEVLCSV
jgi:hypothetical protein